MLLLLARVFLVVATCKGVSAPSKVVILTAGTCDALSNPVHPELWFSYGVRCCLDANKVLVIWAFLLSTSNISNMLSSIGMSELPVLTIFVDSLLVDVDFHHPRSLSIVARVVQVGSPGKQVGVGPAGNARDGVVGVIQLVADLIASGNGANLTLQNDVDKSIFVASRLISNVQARKIRTRKGAAAASEPRGVVAGQHRGGDHWCDP